MAKPKRILILGSSGAGKSTLAQALSRRFKLPMVYFDQLVWKPGWVMEERERLAHKVKMVVRRKAWVLDGSLNRHLVWTLPAADTVIFLDYPNWFCISRVLKRIFGSYGRVRTGMSEACPEHWDWEFFTWIWRWPRRNRPGVVEALKKAKKALVFRRPRDLEHWLQSLP